MIALGCDHGGYELKQEIIKYLEEKARKKKEEREKRYKSNHVRYHSKKKK